LPLYFPSFLLRPFCASSYLLGRFVYLGMTFMRPSAVTVMWSFPMSFAITMSMPSSLVTN
jgi:5,10-methenyltetrahydromethanopterin hydrogenase